MNRDVDYIEIVAHTSGEDDLRKTGGIITELMERAKKAGAQVDDLADELKELGESSQKTKPEMEGLTSTLKAFSGYITAALGIKEVINVFGNFDDVARKVKATIGASSEEMKLLRYQAKELGATTSWSASESAAAQYEFAKAGFSVNQTLAATPGVLDTAIAAEMGLAEATEITAGTLRIFKLDATKAGRVGDMLAKTASSSSVGVRDLAETLKYCGTGATQFGLSLEQTLGILGQLGNLNLKGSQAGTAIQSMFSALMNKEKAKLLTSIDVQLTANGSYRNIIDIIEDIKEKTKNMAPAQQQSFISQVFGEQGGQAINRLLQVPREELQAMIGEIKNSEGFAKQMAKTLNGGLGGALRNMKSATEGVAIALGEYLEPTIISIFNGITDLLAAGRGFIEWLNSGSYLTQGLTITVTALTAGYVAYKGALMATAMWEKGLAIASGIKNGILITGQVVTMAASVAMGILTGQTTLAAGATWLLNSGLAILGSPIAIIAGAVAALGVAFYGLWKRSETFKNAMIAVAYAIITPFKALFEWLKKFEFIRKALNIGKEIFQETKEAVSNGIGNITTAGSNAKSNVDIQNEINTRTQEVLLGAGKTDVITTSTGEQVNTDYLITGGDRKKGRRRGYYLRSTGGAHSTVSSSSNVYTNNNSNFTSRYEEKSDRDILLEIKQLVAKIVEKPTNNKDGKGINFYITRTDKEEIINQVVRDLTLELTNG